jgi:hypothetical protein
VWGLADGVVRRAPAVVWRRLAVLAAVALGGSALSAVMIVPAAELVAHSIRADFRAQDVDLGYFTPEALLTLVQPDHFGLLSGRYVGPGDVTQHYFYAGWLVVPLAVLGARNRRVLGLALGLSLPFLWYASGPAGGLFWLVSRLPGFRSVELPMHGWFLPALSLALLAAAGLACLPRPARRSTVGAVLVGVLFIDLWLVNQLWLPLAYARAPFDQLYGAPLRSFAAAAEAAGAARLAGPELAQVGYRNHGLQSRVVTTYGYNPLELTAYAAYAAAAEGNPHLIEGLAVDHTLGADGTLDPVVPAQPVADIAHALRPMADPAASRAALAALDPTVETLVEGSLPPDVQGTASGHASVVSLEPNALTVDYSTPVRSVLRLAMPAYPGWTAALGAVELPTVRVDHALLGVVVPAGTGRVHLVYEPRSLWLGAAISGVAWLVLGALLLVFGRGHRPAQ